MTAAHLRPYSNDSVGVVVHNPNSPLMPYCATIGPDGIDSAAVLNEATDANSSEREQLERALTALSDPAELDRQLHEATEAAWARVNDLDSRPPSPVQVRLLAQATAHAHHCDALHAAHTASAGTARQLAFALLRDGFEGSGAELLAVVSAAHKAPSCGH